MNALEKGIFFILYLKTVKSFNSTDEKRLLDTYQNIDNQLRPIFNASNVMKLTITISLKTVRNLDMKQQIVSSTAQIYISWIDEFRKWDKDKYGGLDRVELSFSKIWKPDVILANSLDTKNILEDNDKEVIIQSSGKVTWSSQMDLETSCKVNTRYYPFDVQRFTFDFSKLHSDDSVQEIRYSKLNGDSDEFISNGEWVLRNIRPVQRFKTLKDINEKNFTNIILEYIIERRQTYYAWTYLAPTVAFSLISLVSILLPVKSMAKMTISGFSFLAFPVLINIFNSPLPSTSEDNSLFGILLSVNLGLSILVIIVNSIITIIFYRKFPRSLPSKILCKTCNRKPCQCSKCKLCGKKPCNCQHERKTRKKQSYEEHPETHSQSTNTKRETEQMKLPKHPIKQASQLNRDQQDVENTAVDQIQIDVLDSQSSKSSFCITTQTFHNDNQSHMLKNDAERENIKQWSRVATVLDLSLFFVFLLFYGATYAVILLLLFGFKNNIA